MDKPDYGKMPGNQEPNTPDVRESDEPGRYRHEERRQHERRSERGQQRQEEHRQRERREPGREHHPDYGKIPGNQEPNTPDVNESEQRRAKRG